jgi:hypothetical protein
MDVLPTQASSVPCERLFLSGKETCTARRIQPKLMEARQALKFTYRSGLLNLTKHLSDGFYPPEGNVLEEREPLEGIRDAGTELPP